MSELLLKSGLSYLLGSLIGSLIVGRLCGGVDIRTLGSGNAGGTNALRTQGKGFAVWVLCIDIGKGWIATRVIAPLNIPGIPVASPELREWLVTACGIAVILGHVYPLWFGFRGGKGVATLIGVLLGVEPLLLLFMLLTWLVLVLLAGFIGLASITAALALPAYIALSGHEPRQPLLVFGLFVALLVAFTHRANISRMLSGTEPRSRLWLFRRRHS